jgi:hypothetical protein
LLELDPSAKGPSEIAHKLTEIDALISCEVDDQLISVELPLGFCDLHLKAVL